MGCFLEEEEERNNFLLAKNTVLAQFPLWSRRPWELHSANSDWLKTQHLLGLCSSVKKATSQFVFLSKTNENNKGWNSVLNFIHI